MLGIGDNIGTVGRLWKQYQDTNDRRRLADGTRADYAQCSTPLLAVFWEVRASEIRATDVARYLRIERKDAPVRANRGEKMEAPAYDQHLGQLLSPFHEGEAIREALLRDLGAAANAPFRPWK